MKNIFLFSLSSLVIASFSSPSLAESACGSLCPEQFCNGMPPKCAARKTTGDLYDIELKGLNESELRDAVKSIDSKLKSGISKGHEN